MPMGVSAVACRLRVVMDILNIIYSNQDRNDQLEKNRHLGFTLVLFIFVSRLYCCPFPFGVWSRMYKLIVSFLDTAFSFT